MLHQMSAIHAAPPNIFVQADLTFEFVIPQVIVLDMFDKGSLGVESAVTRECVLFKVSWWRGPGAGVKDAEVDSLAVSESYLLSTSRPHQKNEVMIGTRVIISKRLLMQKCLKSELELKLIKLQF